MSQLIDNDLYLQFSNLLENYRQGKTSLVFVWHWGWKTFQSNIHLLEEFKQLHPPSFFQNKIELAKEYNDSKLQRIIAEEQALREQYAASSGAALRVSSLPLVTYPFPTIPSRPDTVSEPLLVPQMQHARPNLSKPWSFTNRSKQPPGSKIEMPPPVPITPWCFSLQHAGPDASFTQPMGSNFLMMPAAADQRLGGSCCGTAIGADNAALQVRSSYG